MLQMIRNMLSGYRTLEHRILESGCKKVLFDSYAEYLAPLWAWRFRRLRRSGVRFAAIAHDPVRDFVVGPLWWHRWSISHGYSFLDLVFVHEAIELDTGLPQQKVKCITIPQGTYRFPSPTSSRAEARERLRIPHDAPLFLCFGHLRDGKNLNLIIEALTQIPSAWLLIAGTEAGTGHIKSAELRQMAEKLGVHERCRWNIGFVSPEDAADLFEASDYVMLTYSRQFRSASGVLNVAARYEKPVVASCGPGNLATAVKQYALGIYVEPDSVEEIVKGMKAILSQPPHSLWQQYKDENSWEQNAKLVNEAFDSLTFDKRNV